MDADWLTNLEMSSHYGTTILMLTWDIILYGREYKNYSICKSLQRDLAKRTLQAESRSMITNYHLSTMLNIQSSTKSVFSIVRS